MLPKSVLIAVLGVATIGAEASAIHRPFSQIGERRARALEARQNRGQFGGGGFGKGKGQAAGGQAGQGQGKGQAGAGQGGQGQGQGQNQGNAGQNGGNQNQNNGGNNGANGANCLNANVIQKGSQSTGQVNGVAADGQVNSAT